MSTPGDGDPRYGRLDTLKERPEWVCWTYEERDGDTTKPPIAPFDGQKYASSTDPETWRTFDEALAYHDRDDTDTEGVGLMLHEDGLVVGVDLDGCHNPETDETEPWTEDIIERLDTYTEVSPSGTGYRLFLLGFLPLGRNKQKQERTIDLPDGLADEKNAEVEVYDEKRYMTFTGDHVEGTPTEAQERASAFSEVYADYVAEDDADTDRDDASASTPVDLDGLGDDGDGPAEFENEYGQSLAQIREKDGKLDALLSSLEPGYSLPNDDDSASGYDYAAATKLYWWRFDARDIARILRRYRHREKIERDDYVQRTIENASGGEQCDPPAKQSDDPTDDPTDDYTDPLAADADGDDDDDDDQDDDLGDQDASGEGEGDHEDDAPDVPTPRYFAVNNGCYGEWVHNQRKETEEWDRWTNFQLVVDSFLRVNDDAGGATETRIALTVHPATDKEPFDVTVTPGVFDDPRSFKEKVVSHGLTTTFDGGQKELNRLKEFVGKQDADLHTGAEKMGLHGDEFVFPEGTLTADGWTDDPETRFVDTGGDLTKAVELTPDVDEYDPDNVAEILQLLPQTRDPERLLPVIGWFYTAPLRPVVAGEWGEGQFNLANVLGETESGKSATLRVLWQMFGMHGKPLSAKSETYFTALRTLSSTNGVPVWYDEYKPSQMGKSKLNGFHHILRTSTSGGTAQRGNADKSVDSYTLDAPIIVSGEQRIQGPAEKRRTIMTTYKKSSAADGSPTKAAFDQLDGGTFRDDDGNIHSGEGHDYREHALAYYRWLLQQDRDDLHALWLDAAERSYEILEEHDAAGVGNLPRQGVQTIVFGAELYRRFAADMGVADVDAAVSHTDVDAAAAYAVGVFQEDGAESHLGTLLELAARAATDDNLEEGKHYAFVHEGTEQEELRINLSKSFDRITRYVREYNIEGEDLFTKYNDYRGRIEEAYERTGSYIVADGQNTPPIGRCVGVHVERAEAEITGFRATRFRDTPDDEAEEQADTETAVPLSNLSPGAGYATVSVEVLTTTADTPDALQQKGTVLDGTGIVDFIAWSSEVEEPLGIEEGECYLLRNVKMGTDQDGAPQLTVTSVTMADPIEKGAHHTSAAMPETGQRSLSADGGDDEETQSGRIDAVLRAVRTHDAGDGVARGFLSGAVASDGYSPENVADTVDQLLQNGVLMETGEGDNVTTTT